jgi:hypothetical protein
MEYAEWHTITGMTIEDLRKALDKELPADAYKAIPGQSYLTDINPGYMKQCLNDVFGICGMGWNYEYNPAHLLIQNGSKDGWTEVLLKTGTFWFMMVDEVNEMQKITITASGGSENKQMQHALKGAITNMIGNAVSQIGFQSSVYMGKRSHNTAGKSGGHSGNHTGQKAAQTPASNKAPAAKAPATAVKAPATKAKAPAGKQPVQKTAAAPAPASPKASFVVSKGVRIHPKHEGKTLEEMSDDALRWYAADTFTPADDAGTELKQKCISELEKREVPVAA